MWSIEKIDQKFAAFFLFLEDRKSKSEMEGLAIAIAIDLNLNCVGDVFNFVNGEK